MKHFPMFLAMDGREAVICGGGEQAAQKVRLMLRTSARIRVMAPRLDPELESLAAAGRLVHDTAPASARSFAGAALVFIATGCPALDASLHGLARAAGAVVNVVDRPELCTAFTPSIVDRAPLVVAIGTEGQAPVLARRLRAEIEALLEPGLGALAALAGRMRGAVAQSVPRAHRRRFWDWVFSDLRRMNARGAGREAARLLKTAAAAGTLPGRAPGAIALVGAGPGAADLLTLRALQRLQTADVIFYDRLVDPAVLDLARRDAERVYTGKSPGTCDWPQERINALITAAARAGRQVVRLKSGDPALFGRAEEELAAARALGIPVEIVPGITAASAAAAALGRALTERGVTGRATFATATGCGGTEPDLAEIAQPGTTLALYMAVGRAAAVGEALTGAGWPPETAVSVVASASCAQERIVETSLGRLAADIAAEAIANPAVLLIRLPETRAAAARARLAATA